MYKYRSKDGCCHVKPDVQSNGIETCVHTCLEQPYRDKRHNEATNQGIENLTASIKLQMLLIACTDTGNEDAENRGEFAPNEIAIIIDEPSFHAIMDIANNTSPVIKQLWIYGILEKLNYERYVDECSEYLIDGLKFFGFFHF